MSRLISRVNGQHVQSPEEVSGQERERADLAAPHWTLPLSHSALGASTLVGENVVDFLMFVASSVGLRDSTSQISVFLFFQLFWWV